MFDIVETIIPGCRQLLPAVRGDARGRFVKVFHEEAFAAAGLATDFAEQYSSRSRRGVLRGLHFQEPPYDHDKLVYCVAGRVLDVAVDLRLGSPAYGRHAMLELSAEAGNIVFVPRGLAHGVLALSEDAIIVNNTTTVYAPEAEAGIAWNSAGIDWPESSPILSPKDAELPQLRDYDSPFRFEATVGG